MSDVFFTLAQASTSGTSGTGVGIPGASAAPIPAATAAPTGATTGTGTTQTATGTAPTSTGPAPSIWSSPLIPMLGVMAVFMLLMWWQGRKQSKQRETLLNSVKKHDKVATTSGIIGTVVELNDQEMVLAVENGKIRFSRSALATVLKSEGKTDPKSDAKIEAKPLTTASV
jgi:preprotein translocase subunit YajC